MSQTKIKNLYIKSVEKLTHFDFLPPLFSRITMGWIFMFAGWGKLQNIEPVIGYFNSLGIPLASVQAPVVATLELIGGIALLLGLGTRIASIILTGVMTVALLTAHIGDIHKLADLFKIYEFTYILLMFYLVTRGAGKLSFDEILRKK